MRLLKVNSILWLDLMSNLFISLAFSYAYVKLGIYIYGNLETEQNSIIQGLGAILSIFASYNILNKSKRSTLIKHGIPILVTACMFDACTEALILYSPFVSRVLDTVSNSLLYGMSRNIKSYVFEQALDGEHETRANHQTRMSLANDIGAICGALLAFFLPPEVWYAVGVSIATTTTNGCIGSIVLYQYKQLIK